MLSIPASWQLLADGYFEGHDSLLHLLRMVEFDARLQSGDFFPRWAPDLALGYGYPLFNFYPPLTYYLAEVLHILGLGYGDALKALMVMSLIVSGLGMYAFAKAAFESRPMAVLSAVAFIYFPYHLTDIYVRGAFPEAAFVAILPFSLWAFHRLAMDASSKYVAAGGFAVAALVLSHVIFIFWAPLLAAYSLLIVLLLSDRGKKKALAMVAVAFVLGIALTAFYWLPVMSERQYVSAARADWLIDGTLQGELQAFHDLVQWAPSYDYEAKFPPKLAAADLVLAVAGLGAWLLREKRRRLLPVLLVFLAATPVLILLLTDLSFSFWQSVPLVGLIQFPWRLLAFVGLSTSVSTGLLAGNGKASYPVIALACAVIMFAGARELKVHSLELGDTPLSLATIARYEYESGVMGTAYANEWLPTTAKPGFTSPRYDAFLPPEPDGAAEAEISDLRAVGPLGFAARVATGEPTRLRLHSFYFPGWQAKVDGKAVRTYPSTPLGLTTFDVPEGQHDVSISFDDTLSRALGRVVSLTALSALSLVCFSLAIRTGRTTLYALGIFPVAVVGLIIVQSHYSGERGLHAMAPPVDFAGQVRLLGYEFEDGPAVRDGRGNLTLYWQALQPVENLQMSLEALDKEGNLIETEMEKGPPIFSTSPTSTWSENEVVREVREIPRSSDPRSAANSFRVKVWAETDLLGTINLEALP